MSKVELDPGMVLIGKNIAAMHQGMIEGGMLREEATACCEAYLGAAVAAGMAQNQQTITGLPSSPFGPKQ